LIESEIMHQACLSDIAAELVSTMELNFNEAQGLLHRILDRRPDQLTPKSNGARGRRQKRRRSAARSRDTLA